MGALALAFDLGGTDLRAALVDSEGEILSFAVMPTLAHDGVEAVLRQFEALAAEVRAKCPDVAIAGIGVGAPGPLDLQTGTVLSPPTLSGWDDVPLVDILTDRFGLPVWLENDANAAALGEWRFGAGRGAQSVVFATVSTGIGGGVIVDGRLLHGRRGLAAEIGHMTMTDTSEPCFCGAIGCFEAVASGTALGHRASASTRPGDGTVLRHLSGNGAVTGRHVVDAARQGDPLAASLLHEEARLLGIGFTNLLHLYAPDVLIMGGGIANGFDLLKPGIVSTVQERAMAAYRDIPIVAAQLGSHAGLIGASSLIFHRDEPVADQRGAARRTNTKNGVSGNVETREANHG